jgi:hypothetical protein
MKIWGMSMWKVMSIFVVALGLFMMGTSVPVQAHDGTVGSDASPIEFFDVTPYNSLHQDAAPYKGFFMLWTKNSTSSAWTGFDFSLSGSNAVFIDTALYDAANPSNPCSNWAFDGDCDPRSSRTISGWNISPNQKNMSVSISSLVNPGQTVWFRVYTDNTASPQGDFTVSASPVLVPEPISSTLFILGAATLGVRRFLKKRVSV